jgi:quercetin dioxygenase-like cupin family protein
MRQRIVTLAMLATLIVGGLAAAMGPSPARAQDNAPKPSTLFQITVDAGVLPPHWSAMRLLRINMDPGSNSPLHTHPGPEMWRVESGTITVFVQGPTKIYPDSDPAKVKDAPQATEFEVKKGDSIAFLPGAAMTFTNKTKDKAKILAFVVLPTGNQAPPGIQYVGQAPSQDAFKGIKSDFLGDGKADSGIAPNANGDIMPAGQAVITLDTLKLTSGQSIPASPNPTLISVAKGSLEFNVGTGCVEVFHSSEPVAQNCAAEGVKEVANVQDALFFPYGLTEITRAPNIDDLSIYRVTITPADSKATPVAAASGTPGTIQVTGPLAPTPTATSEATKAPKATATPKEATTPTAAAGVITQGATVYITEDSVRLRSGPSTSSDIVTGLTLGEQMTVTGPSEQGENFTWWPVQDVNDPSISGYVAADFLSLTPP